MDQNANETGPQFSEHREVCFFFFFLTNIQLFLGHRLVLFQHAEQKLQNTVEQI